MLGSLIDGELRVSMPSNDGINYAVATSADDAAIRQLLRENPMRGAISLTFEREPDYFRGAQLGNSPDQTIVAYQDGRLVCMGRCTTRPRWINGRREQVAYLAELRLDAKAQGRFSILRNGYRFFREQQKLAPASFYFTSIAADNTLARRLLERGVPGLPEYSFLAEYRTLVIPARKAAGGAVSDANRATYAELTEFLYLEGRRTNLATVWDEISLRSLADHGLCREDFQVIRENSRIIACGALWDQRSFRQTVIRGYNPLLTLARPVINLTAGLFGSVALPALNTVLGHAYISPLVVAPGKESVLPTLLTKLANKAASRGISYITLGLSSDDPKLEIIRKDFSARAYASRLYRVTWNSESSVTKLDALRFDPEIAFL